MDVKEAEAAMEAFDPERWETRMREIFGSVAPTVLEIEKKTGKNRPETQKAHLKTICEHWGEIRSIIRAELPPRAEILDLMEKCGMPVYPADLGISMRDTLDAFIGSREIRDKYLTSSLLWDMGLTEETAEKLEAFLRAEKGTLG